MAPLFAVAVLFVCSESTRSLQNDHPDNVRVSASLLSWEPFADGKEIRLKGSCEFEKSPMPSGFDIILWYGGISKSDFIANESGAVFTKKEMNGDGGHLEWEGSIRANYAGEGPYYVEVIPHDKHAYYYDQHKMKISWVKKIRVTKK